MSGGIKCKCNNPKWVVWHYKCNYSYFQYPKGEYHDSKYYLIHCEHCQATWRTKAKYVEKLPMKEEE